jgi:hypothetical protein
VTYNGTLITWAILRHGRLASALRQELEFILKPFRPARTVGPRPGTED